MRIVTLIEDTQGEAGCAAEHGLSFYIETNDKKILLDTGATDLFLKNAEKLGIDLCEVELVVVSHGHYDHGGGISAFMQKDPNAKIYMQKKALGAFYHIGSAFAKYIGIDTQIGNYPQTILLEGNYRISEHLFLFSGIRGKWETPEGNRHLKQRTEDGYVQDDFLHEQCLVIENPQGNILLSGCAHNGILNILETYEAIYQNTPKIVISGFHMMKKEFGIKDMELVRKTAKELKKMDCIFYTGHCTGDVAYGILKECMGEQLQAIHSGTEIMI